VFAKTPSGIAGLDEITYGGLPSGRAALVCGGPGCGKTIFGLEFLVRGAVDYAEPGVFMAFEETAEELAENVASLGFDLKKLEAENKIVVDYVRVERSEIETTGEYDLEGLFVRLDLAIRTVGAKRVVLDTIESLFSGLPNPAILRAEIRRLFRWLKDRGMTVVVTAEQGAGQLTREGLEEYVSDCVIYLDHRVVEQASTRRLRIVKYRGSMHGTNEFPFLIDQGGFSILPITSISLSHAASQERIPTGVGRLDEMLSGKGYYRGSSILVSGSAGTGKSTLAAAFVAAACERGERCLFFAYEESADQLVRNMASAGIDLAKFRNSGLLRLIATRPTSHGLEMHLVMMHKVVAEFRPDIVVIDPISNLTSAGTLTEVWGLLSRVVDFMKSQGITAMMTSLTQGDDLEETGVGVSSVVDSWLYLTFVRSGGERNRTLSIIKSRGMAHSNQAAEFVLSDRGIQLIDTYVGPQGVLTGSARLAQQAQEDAVATAVTEELRRKEQLRAYKRSLLEARIAALREEHAAEETELDRLIASEEKRRDQLIADRNEMARSRRAFEARHRAAGKSDKRR
jgi:circadian clock protein KaiC